MSKRDSFFLSFSYLPNRNFIPSFQERTKGIGIGKNNVSPILDYSAPSEIYVRFEFYISSSSTSPKITFQQGMKFLVKSKVKHLRVSGEATCNNLKTRMDGTSMPCVEPRQFWYTDTTFASRVRLFLPSTLPRVSARLNNLMLITRLWLR